MSDRIKALEVVLDEDYDEEDLDGLTEAIGHLRGVVAVRAKPVKSDDFAARARVYYNLREKLIKAVVDALDTGRI